MEKGKKYDIKIMGFDVPIDPFKVKVLDKDENSVLVIVEPEVLEKYYSEIINQLNFDTLRSQEFYEKNEEFFDNHWDDIVVYWEEKGEYETCLGFKIKFNQC